MMKIIKKFNWIIPLFLIMLMIMMLIPINSFASADDIDPRQWDNGGYTELTDRQIPNTKTTVGGLIVRGLGVILNLVRIVALGWAIIMLIVIAIKYMSASPQAKGQLKTDMPTYLIGSVILFGTAGILKLITMFMGENFN